MKVVLLSGGGGGARFARGLAAVLQPGELTVIGNVGDDVEILGLHVSPDLDSLLYALGGLIDTERGWGRADETWNALESAASWGGEDWFRLGDRDLGLHLVRTEALRSSTLSEVTAALTLRAGVSARIVPATDDRLRTYVTTPAGRFAFQEWFVARRHADEVDAVDYEGSENALAAPGVVESIVEADAILFAPSNPYLSIGPILAVREIRDALERRRGALHRRQPARRRGGSHRPGRPYAHADGRRSRTTPRGCLLHRPDRRPRHRRVGRADRG